MLKLVLLACVVALVAAQDPTRPSHQQHQHIAHGSFMFFYDPASGDMVMETHSHCYLYALSEAQKSDTKDAVKLEALELKLSGLAGETSKQTDITDKPDRLINARCHGRKIVEVKE